MSAAVKSVPSGNSVSRFDRADGQKRRVLYAEDQATARIVTTASARTHGFFDVEAVEDGELAFEKAKLNSRTMSSCSTLKCR